MSGCCEHATYTRRAPSIHPPAKKMSKPPSYDATTLIHHKTTTTSSSNNNKNNKPTNYITTMKLAVLLSTLAVAAGFAPQSQPRRIVSLSMSDDLVTGTVKW